MERLTIADLKRHEETGELVVTEKPVPLFRRQQSVTVEPATEKQVAFLRKLVAERVPDPDPEYLESVIAQGKKRVSQAIDRLLATPPVPQAPAKPEPRSNRYPGRCEECGTEVEAYEGVLTKSDHGTWEVTHRAGECLVSEFPFPVGRYAVDTDEGHLAFYVANHDGLFVQASDDLHRVPRNAQQAVIDKIAADPEAAAVRYGHELGVCGRCGRTLTDENSRALGIGPVCAAKGWEV